MSASWKKAQKWEKKWWGDCINTLFEEEKQLIYADRMGLDKVGSEKTPYVFDLHGASVLDIGGGPVSILLKCVNFEKSNIVDPLSLPEWVVSRYHNSGIHFTNVKAESLFSRAICDRVLISSKGGKLVEWKHFDEVWIYNCLQHTDDPQKIIENAQRAGKLIRIFEWINTPISDGHIQTLTEKDLNNWLGGYGKVEMMNRQPCFGEAYYGVFPT